MEIKTCTRCEVAKPIDQFSHSQTGKYGVRSICRSCERDRRKRPRKSYVEPPEKLCRGCNEVRPIDQFASRTERANGRRSRCTTCASRSHEAWRLKNPGASRDRNLKSKYGLTSAEYLQMLENQGGGCAMCRSTESKWKSSPWLHVDHDHESGEVRELLCHPCNIVAGYVEAGEVSVSELIAYLERHGIISR